MPQGVLVGFLDETVDSPNNLALPSNFGAEEWRSKEYHSLGLLRDRINTVSLCGSIAAIDDLSENETSKAMAYYNNWAFSL